MKTQQNSHIRTSLVIDIENVTRSSAPTLHAAESFHWRMSRMFGSPPDETFVASDPRNAFISQRLAELSHGGFRVRSEKNGADLAIVEYLEEIIERNQRHRKYPIGYLRIASGDGIYVPAIRKLRRIDVHVTVISYRQSTHHRLYEAANRMILLDDTVGHMVAA